MVTVCEFVYVLAVGAVIVSVGLTVSTVTISEAEMLLVMQAGLVTSPSFATGG
jgi:hypothetical protein